jgi:flagellar hook-basal body complex protein FliE
MAIPPIGAISATPAAITSPTTGISAGAGAQAAGGSSFGDAISSSLSNLSTVTDNAQQMAQGVAAGTANLGDYMVAANEANLDTGLTVAVRDKAVQAFNQIMGMQF